MVRADGAVFDVFCEPGLGIKIKGRPWDRPFCTPKTTRWASGSKEASADGEK